MRSARRLAAIAVTCFLGSVAVPERPRAEGCPGTGGGLGVSRIVEVDASSGPLYGDISRQAREETFLGPKEVVLTFDDGPMPWITKSILDTLDRYCTKATFFSVGRMALAYPATVRDVLDRGHTLGGHTHTHPLNIARLPFERASDEIERGFAAIALAAGRPIAPFFRFPGLSDSPALLAHLQARGIATFTVDVVSNDSYIGDAARLARLTLERIEARRGGILLFHDIKASTAKALPQILGELKSRGYRVVHLRAKTPLEPRTAAYEAELSPRLAKIAPAGAPRTLIPFYGTTGPQRVDARGDGRPVPDGTAAAAVEVLAGAAGAAANPGLAPDDPPVTLLAPAPRERLAAAAPGPQPAERRREGRRSGESQRDEAARVGGWSTRVAPATIRKTR